MIVVVNPLDEWRFLLDTLVNNRKSKPKLYGSVGSAFFHLSVYHRKIASFREFNQINHQIRPSCSSFSCKACRACHIDCGLAIV